MTRESLKQGSNENLTLFSYIVTLEILEELQQEASETLDRPSEPCHIDDVISGTDFMICDMTA